MNLAACSFWVDDGCVESTGKNSFKVVELLVGVSTGMTHEVPFMFEGSHEPFVVR